MRKSAWPEWGTIDQPHRIARVLRALASERAVGRLVHAPQAHAALLPIDETKVLRFRYDGPALENADVELASTHALYRVAVGPSHGPGILTAPFPEKILRRSARRERRVPPPPNVYFCFHDPSGFLQRRAVADVSTQGLGFRPLPRDVAGDAPVFADAWIDWMGTERIAVDFRACGSHEVPGTGELVLGGKLTPSTNHDRARWVALVEAILYPRTVKRGDRPDGLWQLYADSGYFQLSGKDPSCFAPLRAAFGSVLPRLAAAPELGIQILWPSSRGVEAAVTGAVPYSHSAFLYQLARRPGRPPEGTPKQLLREGYMRALEWVELREDVNWLIIWVQDAGGRISKELHLDFGLRHDDGVTGCVRRFHVLEMSTTRARPSPSGVSVRDASSADVGLIADRASQLFPRAYVDAHMLGRDELAVSKFPHWESAGIRRARRVLVAERDGQVVAAATVTMAEEGVHLYRLFDLVEVIRFGDYDVDAVEELLASAGAWLGSLGVGTFVYACDAAVPQEHWPSDVTDLGLTHCTTVSKSLLPELVEDVWLVTAGD